MGFKPISRFDIQWVFADGGYVRFESKRGATFTAARFAAALREYADMVERSAQPATADAVDPVDGVVAG